MFGSIAVSTTVSFKNFKPTSTFRILFLADDDGAARNRDALSPHLLPDLICTVDPHIGLPDPLNLRLEGVV